MALNLPGLFGDPKTMQTADYRTAGSHQAENIKYAAGAAANAWVEIHVVTTDKTYYVSGIMLSSSSSAATGEIGTGAAGSEVTILSGACQQDNTVVMALPTPMKVSSGTRIAVRNLTAAVVKFTLIGWEE